MHRLNWFQGRGRFETLSPRSSWEKLLPDIVVNGLHGAHWNSHNSRLHIITGHWKATGHFFGKSLTKIWILKGGGVHIPEGGLPLYTPLEDPDFHVGFSIWIFRKSARLPSSGQLSMMTTSCKVPLQMKTYLSYLMATWIPQNYKLLSGLFGLASNWEKSRTGFECLLSRFPFRFLSLCLVMR